MVMWVVTGAWLLCAVSVSEAAVWEDREQWDADWDARYSAWIGGRLDDDFFVDPKRPEFYRIAHDCSDIPYLARLVFAYEHALPFVINAADAKARISNRTRQFDSIASGTPRLRAFMAHVVRAVNSQTLPNDSYPIALSDIRPGDFFVTPGEHAYLVTGVGPHGILEFAYSTLPTAAQSLLRQRSFPLYVPNDDTGMRDGYRRFRQPAELALPYAEIDAFSPQQYEIARTVGYEFEAFNDAVARALGGVPETPEQQIERMIDELCAMHRKRIRYVDAGVEYLESLRASGRACLTEAEYRQYSTFHRDRRLTIQWSQLHNLYRGLSSARHDSEAYRRLTAIFSPYEASPKHRAAIAERCTLTITPTIALDLIDLRRIVVDNKLESDPHADREQRWGLSATPFESGCRRYEDL